jgi:hypothetical protein
MVPVLSLIFLLLVGMAAGLPFYLERSNDSRPKLCRTNMEALAEAVQECRRKSRSRRYVTDLKKLVRDSDLPGLPLCPSDGKYRILRGPATTIDGKRVPPGGFAVEDYGHKEHGSVVRPAGNR